MRIPLTFSEEDCQLIAEIINEVILMCETDSDINNHPTFSVCNH